VNSRHPAGATYQVSKGEEGPRGEDGGGGGEEEGGRENRGELGLASPERREEN